MARSKLKMLHINEEWCKGCGICVSFCPQQVLILNESGKAAVADAGRCTVCLLCEMRCPDLAITVETEGAADNEQIA
jgi:2-oxoglutarate ferredoxin oxidoreductase subunit delta